MKLGAWLKEYRQRHNMTMKDMAEACGFSKSYVNMLEKGVNTSTNKPVSPTLQTFEKIARATGQDIDSLLKIIEPHLPKPKSTGRSGINPRTAFNAIFWMLDSGAKWRYMPKEFGNWNSIYHIFRKWLDLGVYSLWSKIFSCYRGVTRRKCS